MSRPKLSQRKIDRCRDHLHMVYETLDESSEHPTDVQMRNAIASALSALAVMELLLNAERSYNVVKVETVETERV